MNQVDIQLLIFYGGLPIFLGAGLLYALREAGQGKAKSVPAPAITNKLSRAESLDALNRELTMEFTDRVHVTSAYVQMALGEHPALTHPELMALYREAVDRLEDLYQAVGRMDKP